MTTTLTWLGHGSWSIKSGQDTILLDPFLNDSPTAPVKADEVDATVILVSHGHFDHIADVAEIAKRTGAQVIAMVEVAEWLKANQDVTDPVGMNLGGTFELRCGSVKMTMAHHSSSMPDGSYGGSPAGFILTVPEGNIYFACDTALFGDMALIGKAGIDLAILPIGDHYTMGIDDAVQAVQLIRPKQVAPAHYNTWPPIAQDAQAWAAKVAEQTDATPNVIEPGGEISL